MRKLAAILIFIAHSLGAQVIPFDRIANWNAGTTVGVPGGIPTGWTQFCDASASIPGTNIVCDPTGLADCSGALWAALALCPSNQFIYLPQGVYLMTTRLQVQNTFGVPWINNRIIRGHSARTTNTTILLRITNSTHNGFTIGSTRVADGGQFQNGTAAVSLSSDLATGASTVTLSSVPADIFPGSILWFDEINDDVFVTSKGSGWATGTGATAYDRPRNGTRNRASYHRVSTVVGNTITFSPPIPLGFWTARSAIAIGSMSTRSGAAYGCNIGFENINFEEAPTADMGAAIRLTSVTGCWVKDCRFFKIKSRAIQPANAVHCEITGNDFIKAGAYTVNRGYCVEATSIGGCLIENNGGDEWYIGIILENSSYNVVAANAFYWSHDSSLNTQISDSSTHAAFCTMNLWEQNILNRIQWDFYHGSSAINTAFRNHLRGVDTNITQNRFALMIDTKSVSNNVVGNVLGDPSVFWYTALTNYDFNNTSNMIMRLGYPEIGNNRFPAGSGANNGTLDMNVTNTLLLHANVYRNQSSIWETQYDSDVLAREETIAIPDSYYRSSKPSYWGATNAWPGIGSDLVGYTNLNPAAIRILSQTAAPAAGAARFPTARRFGF